MQTLLFKGFINILPTLRGVIHTGSIKDANSFPKIIRRAYKGISSSPSQLLITIGNLWCDFLMCQIYQIRKSGVQLFIKIHILLLGIFQTHGACGIYYFKRCIFGRLDFLSLQISIVRFDLCPWNDEIKTGTKYSQFGIKGLFW